MAITAGPREVASEAIDRAEDLRTAGLTLTLTDDETDVVIAQWNLLCRQGTARSTHSRYHAVRTREDRVAACREHGHLYVSSYMGAICVRCTRNRAGR